MAGGVRINTHRLLDDLRALARFGGGLGPPPSRGVRRPAFSAADLEARAWLTERFEDAGLDTDMDGIGNVLGRSRNPGKALLCGSHSDSQPEGGWLDGALGVVYALEAARALRECAATRHVALDVVSWQDEEGRFGSLVGSNSFVGNAFDPDAVSTLRGDDDGDTLARALARAGLVGRAPFRYDAPPFAGRYAGYFEAHIEQGRRLDASGGALRVGVVSGIVGYRLFRVSFSGEQNHAGSTLMRDRRDAGLALVRFATALDARFGALCTGSDAVWTFGRAEFTPGAPSIVPGAAELVVQFRDADDARLDELEACLRALVAEFDEQGGGGGGGGAEEHGAKGPGDGCAVGLAPLRQPVAPAPMDASLRHHVRAACEAHAPGAWTELPSGAVHDAQLLGTVMPAAMLFVPSIGGVSHAFGEDTREADLVLGAQVYAAACANMLLLATDGDEDPP